MSNKEVLLDRNNWDYIANTAFANAIARDTIKIEELRERGMSESRLEEIQIPSIKIRGCTDSLADNYNSQATIDDGTCEYGGGGGDKPQVEIHFEIDEVNSIISAKAITKYVQLPLKNERWTNEKGESVDNRSLVGEIIKVEITDYVGDNCSDTQPIPVLTPIAPLTIENIRTTDQIDQILGSVSFDVSGGTSPYEVVLYDNDEKEINTSTFTLGQVQISDLENNLYKVVVNDNKDSSAISTFEIQKEVSEESFEEYIKEKVLPGKISDEEVMKELEITQEDLENIKTQYRENTPSQWDDLPPRRIPAKTDHWLLGVAGSGKTAMLASLIYHLRKRTLGEDISKNRRGIKYKNYLRRCMYNRCMPVPTPTGEKSFAFMPFDLRDKNEDSEVLKINLIELAGEHVKKLLEEGGGHLQNHGWVSSPNEKVVTLVIDHDAGSEQEQILIQCINLFDQRKALDHVINLVLIITKVDTLDIFKDSSYEEMVKISETILEDQFPILNTTLKLTIDKINRRNKGWFRSAPPIEFKVMPMTVATKLIRNTYIKERDEHYISKYSDYIERNVNRETIK